VILAYSTSSAFLAPTLTSIASALASARIDTIHLFHSGLSNKEFGLVKEVINGMAEINLIDSRPLISQYLEGSSLPQVRGNWNTYLRMFIPELLPNESRVLYLDSDTLVVGEVEELFNLDMEGMLFAGVTDHAAKSRYANIEKPDIISSEFYINCGVLLIDCDLCRKEGVLVRMLDYIELNAIDIRVADQSIINDIFRTRIKLVDIKYNYYSVLHYQRSMFTDIVLQDRSVQSNMNVSNISILHYVGHWFERPWYQGAESFYRSEYMQFYEKLPLVLRISEPFKNKGFHTIYDFLMLSLRRFGLYNLEFFVRYIFMQSLKKIIKVNRK